ncbi:unnamed protein product [Schistosoma mattheei]|uniref:Uncharacterized protein n=1 Tax=Schistosoma mattheei TaxID=31246 RepID=A0A183NVR7_9TREM|nr:unnamed protein product [Schistosoma mattheei]
MTAEKAAREGNMRQLYDTKKLAGNDRKPEPPLNTPNIDAAPTDLPIDVGRTTIEVIGIAIRQIKSGKAAGPDNISAESLKTSTTLNMRKHLIALTGQYYGAFFHTAACLRTWSTSYGILMMD